jgi:hypothetical protein
MEGVDQSLRTLIEETLGIHTSNLDNPNFLNFCLKIHPFACQTAVGYP